MNDDLAPVYAVQTPLPTAPGGEAMGAFWLMACAMWAYAIYRFVPDWSTDAQFLLFIGGVYVMELMSVVLQVASFKLRKKRIFRMAPLHHHFELLGWHEAKVITRFWIMGLIMALFALTTLKLR